MLEYKDKITIADGMYYKTDLFRTNLHKLLYQLAKGQDCDVQVVLDDDKIVIRAED